MLDAIKNTRTYQFPNESKFRSFMQRMYFARKVLIERDPSLQMRLGFEITKTKNSDGTITGVMQSRLSDIEQFLVKGTPLNECVVDVVESPKTETPQTQLSLDLASSQQTGPASAEILNNLFGGVE